ncbi:MAG: hypothetical protein LBK66_13030 [Spirochaetaceae bacterium]|nr:hypothetical protein [Spirochaetaceae bacterium]
MRRRAGAYAKRPCLTKGRGWQALWVYCRVADFNPLAGADGYANAERM